MDLETNLHQFTEGHHLVSLLLISWVNHRVCETEPFKVQRGVNRQVKMVYPLVNVYMTRENYHIVNGKTHELSTGPSSMAMLNYQSVSFVAGETAAIRPMV